MHTSYFDFFFEVWNSKVRSRIDQKAESRKERFEIRERETELKRAEREKQKETGKKAFYLKKVLFIKFSKISKVFFRVLWPLNIEKKKTKPENRVKTLRSFENPKRKKNEKMHKEKRKFCPLAEMSNRKFISKMLFS